MSDLKNILREEYKKKKRLISPQSLMMMIEEMVDVFQDTTAIATGYALVENDSRETDPTSEEQTSDDVTVIRRPIVKITELWGQPGKDDRAIMEAMMKNIRGNTVQAKIKSVNDFLAKEPKPGQGDISEVMSYLIFLDTFASIISDYGAAVSGFLFEAFLAALFGNTSIQVDDPEQVGAKGSLPIEDNQLWMQLKQCKEGESSDECEEWGIVPYSLKVLRQNGPVHGSFKNLVDFFLDPAPQRMSDSITYLIVIKEAEKKGGKFGKWTGSLAFYEFVLTRQNFLSLIGAPKSVPIFGYVPFTVPSKKKQSIGVAIMDDGARKSLAQVKGMPLYQTEAGQPWPDGAPIPAETPVKRLQQVGEREVASAKLFSPEEYERIRGEFTDVEISRQIFASLKDTKGYGSKVSGGAQWTVTPTVYATEDNWKGTIDLRPEVLRQKAEEYTQSLNASIVAIFNALGALSDNINSYFISGEKSAGSEAITHARILKDEVNKVIPEEAIEKQAAE